MTQITVRGKVVKHSNGVQEVTRASLPKQFADEYDLRTGDELLLRVLLIKKGKNHDENKRYARTSN